MLVTVALRDLPTAEGGGGSPSPLALTIAHTAAGSSSSLRPMGVAVPLPYTTTNYHRTNASDTAHPGDCRANAPGQNHSVNLISHACLSILNNISLS